MRRRRRRVLFEIACAALLAGSARAATVAVHPITRLPALRSLTMATGGRMMATASKADTSFGGRDYTYQWPGCYFRAAFKGTSVFFRVVKGDEILHIAVNGQDAGSLVEPAAGVYEVDGLGRGKHAVTVFVATESQAGPNTFGGFAIPVGEKALAPAKRERQIEFIGDSHTVGYGDLSNTHACTRAQVWSDTDDTKAFGPMTARHFDADYQVNAISGRGVVRNYDGFAADTLPQAYPWVLFDNQQKYSDPAWKPQVLVIALGTNDFSTPLHAGERWKTRAQLHADFEARYLKFLEALRARDPNAYMIVWATGMANGEIEAEANKVVEQMKARGDRRIVFLPINALTFGACDGHPTLADEKVISEKLVRAIDAEHVW